MPPWPEAGRPPWTRRAALGTLGAGLVGSSLPLSAWAGSALCSQGHHQSPIDLVPAAQRELPALRVEGPPVPLRLVHDGLTVRVRAPASGPGVPRLWVGSAAHRVQQLHLHLPAEHRWRGEAFPVEVHLPCKAASGQFVALALLLREGAPHPALEALLPHLPARHTPEHTVPGVSFDFGRWLPADRSYARYEGSLTAEPCTEGVVWLVLREVGSLSRAQLDALRAVIGPNTRALQPLNGRTVVESR